MCPEQPRLKVSSAELAAGQVVTAATGTAAQATTAATSSHHGPPQQAAPPRTHLLQQWASIDGQRSHLTQWRAPSTRNCPPQVPPQTKASNQASPLWMDGQAASHEPALHCSSKLVATGQDAANSCHRTVPSRGSFVLAIHRAQMLYLASGC